MAKEKIKSPTVKKIPTAKKPRKPKITTHPPYFQMIKEALMALKEKNGSSPYAIAKKIEEKHKPLLPDNLRKTLSLQLKKSVANGKLTKIRASYKLSDNNNKKKTMKQEERKTKTRTRSSSRRSNKSLSMEKQEKMRKVKKVKQPMFIKSSTGKKKVLKASAA